MRLMRVSYPLLTKGADLCGDDIRFTTGMALANQATLLGEDFRESAQKAYQLSDQVQVMYVVPGSAADKAGIRTGDTLRYIDEWGIPTGADAVRQSLDQLKVRTQTGKPVRVDIIRKERGQSLLITPDRACAYPVVLGGGDEVNAYADGKQVIVQRGMMRFAQSDTELALVVSHEIAHNSMGHMRAKMTNYALGSILDIAAQVLLKVPTQGLSVTSGATHIHKASKPKRITWVCTSWRNPGATSKMPRNSGDAWPPYHPMRSKAAIWPATRPRRNAFWRWKKP